MAVSRRSTLINKNEDYVGELVFEQVVEVVSAHVGVLDEFLLRDDLLQQLDLELLQLQVLGHLHQLREHLELLRHAELLLVVVPVVQVLDH